MIDPANPDFGSTPASPDRPSFHYAPASPGPPAQPHLSIVTTFYDTDPAIFSETVLSVERQSLQEWEWVIVDDCSTRDDSLELLAERAEDDPRIRIVRHERNLSVPVARNTGIAQAKGRLILQLDSDDLLEPTAAEKWLWFLTSYPEYSFVNAYQVGFAAQEYLWTKGFDDREAFLKENLTNPTGVARRELFEEVGGFDPALSGDLEDWQFWLRCAAAGHWGTTLPEYLVWYRRKGGDAERWFNWDSGPRQKQLLREWREEYSHLWEGGFPPIVPSQRAEADIDLETLPLANLLVKGERPRLLLIVAWADVGGAGKFNLDLIEHLSRRGWQATVVATLQGGHAWPPRLSRLTPDVFALPTFLRPDDYPRFLRYLIGSRRPDIVLISNSEFAYDLVPYLRRVAPTIPIVDYCHVVEEYWARGGYPRMSLETRHLLDLQITASQHVKDWMTNHGGDPDRIEVCRINIDPGNGQRPSRARLKLPTDVPLVIYPGRLVFQKQPQVFAKTVRELRRRGGSFHALVVGLGPYLPWLRAFLRRHGLEEGVTFLGQQAPARTRELVAASDMVFLPSVSEGIAVVLYEAMAEGVPVVSADVGGQRELVTPECGLLIAPADEETEVLAYADALQALLADAARRQAMGQAGRARIRAHFTLEMMGERMHDLLERARDGTSLPAPGPEDAQAAALDAIRLVPWTPPGQPTAALPESGAIEEGVAEAAPTMIDLVLATVDRTGEPRRFLHALEAQSYPYFRVIVVDQNEDDRLSEVFAGLKPFPILHLHSAPGNSRARNVGLRHADADIVAFPDDDCWYPPDLLQRVVDVLVAHPEWDGVSGRSIAEDGGLSAGRWDQEPGLITPFNVWSRVNAYTVFLRDSALSEDVWFDETMGLGPEARFPAGEDLDYVLRVVNRGRRVQYDPSVGVYHERKREHSRQPAPADGYRYGLGMGRALRKNRLPWRFVAYQFTRSFGAAVLNLLHGEPRLAAFYGAVGRGRVVGWWSGRAR